MSKSLAILNDHAPQALIAIVTKIASFITPTPSAVSGPTGRPMPPPNVYAAPQPVNNQTTNMTAEEIDDEMSAQQDDYAMVLRRLRNQSPEILPALQKLADIAESDPAQFSMLMNMLKMFQVPAKA
jgi:hypothetical protein